MIGFEVSYDFPTIGHRTFSVDARRLSHPDDNSRNILVIFDDVTERKQRTSEMEFIASETRHRMKNLFTVVRAVAMQTATQDRTAGEYRDVLLGRLETTFRAQELAATTEAADFETLLRQSVGDVGAEQLACDGPAISIISAKVLAISMIFHELTTNALKYGAFSSPGGHVAVSWTVEPGARDRTYLNCIWHEEGGPDVAVPSRKGYGTELIKATSAQAGGP